MSKHGFTRGSDSGVAFEEVEAVQNKVREFAAKGQLEALQEAIQYARGATRHWIAQTAHPHEAFNGKKLNEYLGGELRDNKGQKYKAMSQFRLGHFGMVGHGGGGNGNGHAYNGEISSLNIYANYFARWYSTGLRTSGYYGKKVIYERKGANWWGQNAKSIEEYFCKRVDEKLSKMKLL